jgi:hypothetical protein
MSKEYQEPEERELNDSISDAEILDDFNPLDEAVNEKEYTKPNVKINPKDFAGDIPEPDFMPPPMTGGLTNDEKPKDIKPKEPFNPQVKQMSTKEKRMGSKRVADMLMTAYEWVNVAVDNSLLFNERKINKLQMDGELDLSTPIPISATDTMSAGEFIQEFNSQSKGTIKVTQEFKEEVMPVLIDVLEEEGVTITKKQELAYLIGKDVAVKGFMCYQSLQVKKDMLKMMIELSQVNKQSMNYSQSAPISQPTYTPQPTPEPVYEEEPDFTPPPSTPRADFNPELNVNDFVNQMTGGIPAETQYEEPKMFVESVDEPQVYEEPKSKVKIISDGSKSKRGRPKRK